MKEKYVGRQGFDTTCHYCWEETNCSVYERKHVLSVVCEFCGKTLVLVPKWEWPRFRPLNRL